MKSLKLFLFIGALFLVSNISAQSVYITKTGTKYHKNTCHHLKYSKQEVTLDKALKLGLTACSVCKPTVGNGGGSDATSSKTNFQPSTIKSTAATQCTGTTKSGARCKRMVKSGNGRCYQH